MLNKVPTTSDKPHAMETPVRFTVYAIYTVILLRCLAYCFVSTLLPW